MKIYFILYYFAIIIYYRINRIFKKGTEYCLSSLNVSRQIRSRISSCLISQLRARFRHEWKRRGSLTRAAHFSSNGQPASRARVPEFETSLDYCSFMAAAKTALRRLDMILSDRFSSVPTYTSASVMRGTRKSRTDSTTASLVLSGGYAQSNCGGPV